MDDELQVERKERAWKASLAVLLANYTCFGFPRAGKPPAIKPEKFSDWASVSEVLGVGIDLNRFVLFLPEGKREEAERMLEEEFPRELQHSTARRVLKCCGKLRAHSFCVRPG
eukprot:46096-Eustigmatos_ZCMA.PRE.1